MKNGNYIIADPEILPEIFSKVIKVKKILAEGNTISASEAIKQVGISRGAYYKYKDHVFEYANDSMDFILTVHSVLDDKPGILMKFISVFRNAGANILTVNQNIPVNGSAMVSVSARVDSIDKSVEELINELKSLDGVKQVSVISSRM